jgi:hypothetical protein
MRSFILIALFFVVSCNAILPIFQLVNITAANENDNQVVLKYFRDLKERAANRTQPLISQRIALLFREIFLLRETETSDGEPWNFFQRIMNFFRRLNIFGLRGPEPAVDVKFSSIKCAENTNEIDCKDVDSGNGETTYPEFIQLKEDIETNEPLFTVDNPDDKKSNRVIKEVKKFYKTPQII